MLAPTLIPDLDDTTPTVRLTCTGCGGRLAYPLNKYPLASTIGHHRGLNRLSGSHCVELIISGHDGLPGVRTSAIDEEDAELWVDAWLDLGAALWSEFSAWVTDGHHVEAAPSTVPDHHVFLERYLGTWGSAAQYLSTLEPVDAAIADRTTRFISLHDTVGDPDDRVLVMSVD